MPRKPKGGTEAYLGTIHEALNDYESAVMKRAEAAATLASWDQKLEDIRKRLLHLAGSNGKVPPTPTTTAPKAATSKKKSAADKLASLDPRIQRSMAETTKVLKGLNGSAHKTDIAKKLGISPQAAIQRLSRGVKLGLWNNAGKGVYALPG